LRETLPAERRATARVLPTPIPISLYRSQTRETRRDGLPVVGWIGDGSSHADVLRRLIADVHGSPALARDRFRLRLVGAPRDLGPEVSDGGSVVEVVDALAWEDETSVAATCSAFDVGLAPYRGRGGVAFKVIQYLAAGAVPLVDERSPGVDHLHALPPWLRSHCVTDFEDANAWGAALHELLGLVAGTRRDELRSALAAASTDFDSDLFAARLIAWA
jgi:hypothetical protein